MTRILILLFALNAIFPSMGIASVCASNTMPEISVTDSAIPSPAHIFKHDQGDSHPSAMHCADADMSCNNQDMQDCDSGCCVSCLVISAALTSSSAENLTLLHSVKPVSNYSVFHTRSISPELRPPLV
jgi:hypothetical protein